MTNQRMKGMSLGSFSGIKKPQSKSTNQSKSVQEFETQSETIKSKSKAKVDNKTKVKEKLFPVNIKIREDQKEWLTKTASTVRSNNAEAVPASKRVYPQHLIGVAIDFLDSAEVDWEQIRNVEELREQLNLAPLNDLKS